MSMEEEIYMSNTTELRTENTDAITEDFGYPYVGEFTQDMADKMMRALLIPNVFTHHAHTQMSGEMTL